MSKRRHVLWVHEDELGEYDLVINHSAFPSLSPGDFVDLHQPENEESCHLFLRLPKDPSVKLARGDISVHKRVAETFRLKVRNEVQLYKASDDIVQRMTADFVELTLKGQYAGRNDLFRLRTEVEDTCVYIGKKVETATGISATVTDLWLAGSTQTSCAYVSKETTTAHRSKSVRQCVMIQMSNEMNHVDYRGNTTIERAIMFMEDLFEHYSAHGCRHSVSVVLFARRFYPGATRDDFPDDMKEAVRQDDRGVLFRDVYRVVDQYQPSEDWKRLIMFTKLQMEQFPETIAPRPDEPAGIMSRAMDGNMLEAANLALQIFDMNHIDRQFDTTGMGLMIVSPGCGVARVSKKLCTITSRKILDAGIAFDWVCLGEPALHVTPLFQVYCDIEELEDDDPLYESGRVVSSEESGEFDGHPLFQTDSSQAFKYVVPYWIHQMYYERPSQPIVDSISIVMNRTTSKSASTFSSHLPARFQDIRAAALARGPVQLVPPPNPDGYGFDRSSTPSSPQRGCLEAASGSHGVSTSTPQSPTHLNFASGPSSPVRHLHHVASDSNVRILYPKERSSSVGATHVDVQAAARRAAQKHHGASSMQERSFVLQPTPRQRAQEAAASSGHTVAHTSNAQQSLKLVHTQPAVPLPKTTIAPQPLTNNLTLTSPRRPRSRLSHMATPTTTPTSTSHQQLDFPSQPQLKQEQDEQSDSDAGVVAFLSTTSSAVPSSAPLLSIESAIASLEPDAVMPEPVLTAGKSQRQRTGSQTTPTATPNSPSQSALATPTASSCVTPTPSREASVEPTKARRGSKESASSKHSGEHTVQGQDGSHDVASSTGPFTPNLSDATDVTGTQGTDGEEGVSLPILIKPCVSRTASNSDGEATDPSTASAKPERLASSLGAISVESSNSSDSLSSSDQGQDEPATEEARMQMVLLRKKMIQKQGRVHSSMSESSVPIRAKLKVPTRPSLDHLPSSLDNPSEAMEVSFTDPNPAASPERKPRSWSKQASRGFDEILPTFSAHKAKTTKNYRRNRPFAFSQTPGGASVPGHKFINPFTIQGAGASHTEQQRRWALAIPPAYSKSTTPFGPIWKSLCFPACFPISTDYLPSKEKLEQSYKSGPSRDVIYWGTWKGMAQSTDDAVWLNMSSLFYMTLRLALGFQFVQQKSDVDEVPSLPAPPPSLSTASSSSATSANTMSSVGRASAMSPSLEQTITSAGAPTTAQAQLQTVQQSQSQVSPSKTNHDAAVSKTHAATSPPAAASTTQQSPASTPTQSARKRGISVAAILAKRKQQERQQQKKPVEPVYMPLEHSTDATDPKGAPVPSASTVTVNDLKSAPQWLSFGKQFQKLEWNSSQQTLNVTTYNPETQWTEDSVNYSYTLYPFRRANGVNLHRTFSSKSTVGYAWSMLDARLSTVLTYTDPTPISTVESARFWRARFVLVPAKQGPHEEVLASFKKCLEAMNKYIVDGLDFKREIPPVNIPDGLISDVDTIAQRSALVGGEIAQHLTNTFSVCKSDHQESWVMHKSAYQNYFWLNVNPKQHYSRCEWATVYYDGFYHPDRAFHMEFQWLVATASQINDLLERWRRRVTMFGFRLYCLPISHVDPKIPTSNPFRVPLQLDLAWMPEMEDAQADPEARLQFARTFMAHALHSIGFLLDLSPFAEEQPLLPSRSISNSLVTSPKKAFASVLDGRGGTSTAPASKPSPSISPYKSGSSIGSNGSHNASSVLHSPMASSSSRSPTKAKAATTVRQCPNYQLDHYIHRSGLAVVQLDPTEGCFRYTTNILETGAGNMSTSKFRDCTEDDVISSLLSLAEDAEALQRVYAGMQSSSA
eukprot:m.228230 g.228230  ORF g.228230 m.228230 type:complete len:1818 (-) comp15189_c1_seq5:517-5970(-)